MLYRKAKRQIENWIKNGKDALLITGARQVGKTFLIRETLKENNIDFVEFNLIENKELQTIFKSAVEGNIDRFLFDLRVAARKNLNKDTIIFFDEIQEVKEIVTLIKFLVAKGQFKYILSGSLLGVELTNLRSAPVGYLETLDMFPLDLEEFYIANGLGEDVVNQLKYNFDNKIPVNDYVHKTLIDVFYQYLVIGGMPEAVQRYLDSQNLIDVNEIHKKIYQGYKRDFTKYENNKKLKLSVTYDAIPSELNSKNKRFLYTSIDPNLRFNRYEESFNWLIDAGVALPAYNVTEFQIPLEASKKRNLFKLFLSDVGILTTLYGPSTSVNLLKRSGDINCGAMFENFVCQELIAHGFKTYYFNNKKHGEVDFLIEYKNSLLPIEVKSGKDYQKHNALTYFMSNKYFNTAIVLSDFNVKEKDKILYLPIYMIMFIKNELEDKKIEKIDLSILSNAIKNK